MLAFAVLLAALGGGAAPPPPPPPMMHSAPMPVVHPVVIQPVARPVAPAPPEPHISSVKPQSADMPDARRPVTPEMKPTPRPPFPYFDPYNNAYYRLRSPFDSCSSNIANVPWLNDGSCFYYPAMVCCPRLRFVP
jgi:hypothetical protein